MFDTEANLSTAAHAAIGLKPDTGATSGTRFGGHPNLAEHIDWPKDSAGRPMHHLLQLDCAALPYVDPDMPRDGTLFFFITGSYDERGAPDLMEGDPGGFAVLHQPQAPADVPERAHPDTCPPLGEFSYAENPVCHPVKRKKKGFFERLVNTQPKAYSGNDGTGYFASVPLGAQVFDSFPTAESNAAIDAFGGENQDYGAEDCYRAFQIMGHAPVREDLDHAAAEGYVKASDDKALEVYEQSLERDDILLVQLPHHPAINLSLIGFHYVMQFRISRADLRARALDKTIVRVEEHAYDNLWWVKKEKPSYAPQPEELLPQLALKVLAPLETPASPSNYFCGAPQLPDGMDWPANSEGYPLNFLMQVDCATLPREADGKALPDMPRSGTIFVFAYDYMEDVTADTFKILYTPENVNDLPTRTPPEGLKTLPEYASYSIRGDIVDGAPRRPDPARPFDPVAYTTIAPPAYDDPDFDEKSAFVDGFYGALPHEEKAYPGVELLIDWLPNAAKSALSPERGHDRRHSVDPLRMIPRSYPWRWADIVEATTHFPHDRHQHVSEEHRDQIFPDALIAEGIAWKDKALAADALTRIPDEDRIAYRQWLHAVDGCADNIPSEGTKESNAEYRNRKELEQAFDGIMKRLAQPYEYVSYGSLPQTLYHCAYDQSASDFPDEMREIVAGLVRFQRSDTQLRANNTRHRPNPDRMFAADPERCESDTEVMLFQLSSGMGLPVNWADCCWLQVWIDASDLAEGRFDQIRPVVRY